MDHIFIKLETTLRYFFFGGLLLLLYSFINREVINDDGWLGEQAYFFGTEGVVKSEMFTGFRQADSQIFSYHKLHIWLGGLSVALFGLNIYILKSISLIGLILLLFWVAKYFKKTNQTHLTYFTLTFLLINHHLVEFSFIYRPEVLATALGFGSFYYLIKYRSYKHLIISALLAGFSTLTHLNGVIFILAGLLFLISQKQWKASLYFGGSAFLIFSLFFIDIFIPENNLDTFFYQISSLEPEENLFIKFFKEHIRMFHSPKEIILSVLAFFLILVPLLRKKIKGSLTLRYFFILGLLFMFITPNKTYKYLTFLVPFIAINLAESIDILWNTLKQKHRLILYTGLALYAFINFGFTGLLISKNQPIYNEHNKIAQYIENDSKDQLTKVGCELIFMYNSINKFDLRGTTKYQYLYRDATKLYSYKWDLLFKDMYNDERSYIVLSKYLYKHRKYNSTLFKNYYEQVFETKNHLIFKRI